MSGLVPVFVRIQSVQQETGLGCGPTVLSELGSHAVDLRGGEETGQPVPQQP